MNHLKKIMGLLALMMTTCYSYAAEQGVLRAINNDASQLTIDEGRYPPSPAIEIYNLGAGINDLNDVRIGQPVRFIVDSQGRITKLWLYPLRADERQQLGIHLGDEQQ